MAADQPDQTDGLKSLAKEHEHVRTVTRVDLAEAVYQHVGLSRKESAALVEMVLDEMMDRLVAGEPVKLSSFGSFIIRHKRKRLGRNPKTGVEVPITERRVLVFKPSNLLKGKINGQSQLSDSE
ncbi:integration host factor subunit alpha [Methylovirgula sp. HY1]|uniref:integration host factor subunit alpha n=1 Tax=Methylovirgula sp. HY1 TaxID=2822761 RepID=UPI001C5BAC6C|nr:integration host factor subunit alpha [Methylovirgula sp. HY1]